MQSWSTSGLNLPGRYPLSALQDHFTMKTEGCKWRLYLKKGTPDVKHTHRHFISSRLQSKLSLRSHANVFQTYGCPIPNTPASPSNKPLLHCFSPSTVQSLPIRSLANAPAPHYYFHPTISHSAFPLEFLDWIHQIRKIWETAIRNNIDQQPWLWMDV